MQDQLLLVFLNVGELELHTPIANCAYRDESLLVTRLITRCHTAADETSTDIIYGKTKANWNLCFRVIFLF